MKNTCKKRNFEDLEKGDIVFCYNYSIFNIDRLIVKDIRLCENTIIFELQFEEYDRTISFGMGIMQGNVGVKKIDDEIIFSNSHILKYI